MLKILKQLNIYEACFESKLLSRMFIVTVVAVRMPNIFISNKHTSCSYFEVWFNLSFALCVKHVQANGMACQLLNRVLNTMTVIEKLSVAKSRKCFIWTM